MFTPFLLNRGNVTLSQFIASAADSHQFIASFGDIKNIAPENLKMVYCERPMYINPKEGIPFDLQATIVLLRHRTKSSEVIEYLTKDISYSHERPLILFCGGSMVGSELPYIKLVPNSTALEIASMPFSHVLGNANCYQLHYVA